MQFSSLLSVAFASIALAQGPDAGSVIGAVNYHHALQADDCFELTPNIPRLFEIRTNGGYECAIYSGHECHDDETIRNFPPGREYIGHDEFRSIKCVALD